MSCGSEFSCFLLSLLLCFRAEERKYRRFPYDILFKQESDEEGMGNVNTVFLGELKGGGE